jgi:hypothetical protein
MKFPNLITLWFARYQSDLKKILSEAGFLTRWDVNSWHRQSLKSLSVQGLQYQALQIKVVADKDSAKLQVIILTNLATTRQTSASLLGGK